MENGNTTMVLNQLSSNNNNISRQTNQLDSLYEDPKEQESFVHHHMSKTHDFKKKMHTIDQSNVLINSAVPQTVKLDKVKMFIFYTKAH